MELQHVGIGGAGFWITQVQNRRIRSLKQIHSQDFSLRESTQPIYRQILNELREAILQGKYAAGERLPSEADLVGRFTTSRLTVQRALKELQHEGLIERRAGSGTYVRHVDQTKCFVFGLLIPGLGETEIFEPICQGVARATAAAGHSLLWGDTTQNSSNKDQQTKELCDYYLARKVSGIFFAPLELSPTKDDVNHRVVEALEKANIPIVLLDRCLYQYPRRSRFDLVGIDNRRAGFLVTEHLLRHGCQRLIFLAAPNSAATVDSRIQGFQDAVDAFAIAGGAKRIHIGSADDADGIKAMLGRLTPDGIVCANDITAARLMQTLERLDVKVPQQIRIIGIDDVRYGGLLAVPLTTLHQPCRELGEVAVAAMLQRIAAPDMPTRDILLDCKLVIRRSCGTHADARHG